MSTVVEGDSAPGMVKGSHLFTMENYSLCKGIVGTEAVCSDSFVVGGHRWAISVFPDGIEDTSTKSTGYTTRDINAGQYIHVGFCVTLMSESVDGVRCLLKMTLLDQSGQGNHKTASLFDDDKEPILISTHQHNGFPQFIRRDVLESSCYLKDDCLKIECTLGVVLPSDQTETTTPSDGCDDDVGFPLLAMLEGGEGCDVVFDVRGEKFRAHKMMLSARSSVFQSMFASNQQEEIVIKDMEPRLFKVLLHFIYTDTLPKYEKSLAEAYAFGPSVSTTLCAKLLAAADEYNVTRLKAICESHLWRSISLKRFAETLSLAERYNASALKHLCFEYAADHYAALVRLDGFAYLQTNFLLLLKELDNHLLTKGMASLRVQGG